MAMRIALPPERPRHRGEQSPALLRVLPVPSAPPSPPARPPGAPQERAILGPALEALGERRDVAGRIHECPLVEVRRDHLLRRRGGEDDGETSQHVREHLVYETEVTVQDARPL